MAALYVLLCFLISGIAAGIFFVVPELRKYMVNALLLPLAFGVASISGVLFYSVLSAKIAGHYTGWVLWIVSVAYIVSGLYGALSIHLIIEAVRRRMA